MNGDKKPADLVPLPLRAWKFGRLGVVAGALLLTLLGVVAWQRSSPARAWKALVLEVFQNQGSVAGKRPETRFNTFIKPRAPALLRYLPTGLPESCSAAEWQGRRGRGHFSQMKHTLT